MPDFEFVKEPPKRTNKNTGYIDPRKLELAEACRAHPGEWLKVPTSYYAHLHRGPTAFSRTIKDGTSPAFPPGEFDAKVREGIVYMMYKGKS